MIDFGEWNTTTNTTTSTTIDVYSFSRLLNLIVPYLASLLLAVPFILIRGIALHNNGTSVIDRGFMQIIATTTGGAIVDKAVARGCLGVDESIPQELKDLKIRFKGIIDREELERIK